MDKGILRGIILLLLMLAVFYYNKIKYNKKEKRAFEMLRYAKQQFDNLGYVNGTIMMTVIYYKEYIISIPAENKKLIDFCIMVAHKKDEEITNRLACIKKIKGQKWQITIENSLLKK